MTYRISTVADMTGIPRNTLLAWERRYGLVRPFRHDNGYRYYSEEEVALILRLKNAMAAGLRIGEAVELLRNGSAAQRSAPSDGDPITFDFPEIRRTLLDALLGYRRSEAEAILHRLLPVPFRTRLKEVFFPILHQIGDLWSRGEVTIAQEHYASAIFRAHLAALLITIGTDSPFSPHAVTTTFVGDNHELAALALAIQLSVSGYRVSYLGPNLPANELVQFVRKQSVTLACVSCILPPSEETFRGYLAEIAEVPSTRWVLGGTVPDIGPLPAGVEVRSNWSEFPL